MKTAGLYARVSTEEQTEENQVRELLQLARARGWEPRPRGRASRPPRLQVTGALAFVEAHPLWTCVLLLVGGIAAKGDRPGTPSETQLDLAEGVRRRTEGETTADTGAQVLGRLRALCKEPDVGAAPVRTVRQTCAVPLDVMRDCRRRREPFPDPHDWKPAPADAGGAWWQCARCLDVTRIPPKGATL